MAEGSFSKRFSHRGKRYTARFFKRPFREGLEVTVTVGDHLITVGELGLGEKATINKLKAEIDLLDKRLTARRS